MKLKYTLSKLALAAAGMAAFSNSHADELKFVCYQDANESSLLHAVSTNVIDKKV